jgi:hypothetical protein
VHQNGLVALPADPRTLALYLTDCAACLKASTIGRRLSSISQAHQAAGHPSPTKDALVAATWAGIRRTLGTAQHGKAPIRTADLRRMVEDLTPTLGGKRDRALLLLGFAGGFRRSELVCGRWGERTGDHEPDRSPKRHSAPKVHPGGLVVSGERRRAGRTLNWPFAR